MTLERLWAGWRSEYVSSAAEAVDGGCVLCGLVSGEVPDDQSYLLWRGERSAAVLNAYPYNTGHLMVLPVRHVGELEDLETDESAELWTATIDAVRAIKAAYSPEGVNVGANLGRASGAGVPGHAHLHCLPRWNGDTNFMTTVAEVRVLSEALPASWEKLRAAWPR